MIETANFPNSIWDGLSKNTNRTSRLVQEHPDYRDWDQLTAEVISLQKTSKSDQVIYPHQFAKGSGTNSDPWTGWDTAIQWQSDVKYIFANGVFTFSQQPSWQKDRIWLEGSGASILRWTGVDNYQAVINMDSFIGYPTRGSGDCFMFRAHIKNLVLDGNGKCKDCIYNNSQHHFVYESIIGGGTKETFIRLRGPTYGLIVDCNLFDMGVNGTAEESDIVPWLSWPLEGIRVDRKAPTPGAGAWTATAIVIRNCELLGWDRQVGHHVTGGIGLHIVAATDIVISGGDLENWDTPVVIDHDIGNSRFRFENVDMEACSNPILLHCSGVVFDTCNLQADLTIAVDAYDIQCYNCNLGNIIFNGSNLLLIAGGYTSLTGTGTGIFSNVAVHNAGWSFSNVISTQALSAGSFSTNPAFQVLDSSNANFPVLELVPRRRDLFDIYVRTGHLRLMASAGDGSGTIEIPCDVLALGSETQTNAIVTFPAKNAVPSDGFVGTSRFLFYLDEASNTLKVRVRYANGTTLKLGSIALV